MLIRRKDRCGVFAGNCVIQLWALSGRVILTIGAIQVHFLSFINKGNLFFSAKKFWHHGILGNMVAIIPIFMGKVSLNVEHLCTKFVKARNTCIMPNSEWYEVLHWHSITFFLFRLESVDTLRCVSLCREQTWWRTEVCQYISNHWWSVVSNGIASVTELSPDLLYHCIHSSAYLLPH